MAATAEAFYCEPDPTVLAVPDMPEDVFARKQAERLIRNADALGSLAVGALTEVSESDGRDAEEADGYEKTRSFVTLLDAVKAAAEGDDEARKVIEMNVRTDVIERTIKAGHVMEVGLEVDESGAIGQYGQTIEDVYSNALRFASGRWQMRQRSEAEARNGMRLQNFVRQGLLDDYYFVVVSRAADNMSQEELKKCGFFTDTMSCAIQGVTFKDGRLVQESAFVAGVAEAGAARHDEQTVVKLGERLGVDFAGKSSTELLDTPLLIPKTMMPSGVADIVALYDEAAGGTFFGEDKPRQDYDQYLEKCKQREADMEPTVQEIIDDLVGASASLHTPVDATGKLAKLSESHLVERSITDTAIDPRVFDTEAAGHIEEARYWWEQGNMDQYRQSLVQAINTARSSSCPTSGAERSKNKNRDSESSLDGDERDNASDEGSGSSKADRKKWKTKWGVCMVNTCPSRPGRTEVGPCGVCMDRCQVMFDKGEDPTKGVFAVTPPPPKQPTADLLQFIKPEKWLLAPTAAA